MRDGKMKLGLFMITAGHHVAAWRHPAAYSMDSFAHWAEIARIAENARFDMLFLADGWESNLNNIDTASRTATSAVPSAFEPITLLASLAAVTSHIGLAATASTSFTEPYNLARQFASLDHLSGGRAAWNIVTAHQAGAALNYGIADFSHTERYRRAEEYVDVVRGLWDSWEDDAFERDRETGRYFDPEKVQRLNHKGRYYAVRGPLNLPRSPQGHPVLIQAGQSGPGMDLAARVADIVFTAHQSQADAIAYYADIKKRAGRFGRSADAVIVLPGITPILGSTQEEAERKKDELRALIDIDVAMEMLSIFVPSVRGYPLDDPFPDLPETEGNQSRQKLVVDMARRGNMTLREAAIAFASARGHWLVAGTPEQIADEMEDCFIRHGCDGFNLTPSIFPGGLVDFVDHVLPILRKRGRFRDEYEGPMLRDQLGVARPAFVRKDTALAS